MESKAPTWAQETDIQEIHQMLESRCDNGFLKPRTLEYIGEYISRFVVVRVGDILAGCMELRPSQDSQKYVELGAFATQKDAIERHVRQEVAQQLISFALNHAKEDNIPLISLTNNPRLQCLYREQGLHAQVSGAFPERETLSPGVQLYSL